MEAFPGGTVREFPVPRVRQEWRTLAGLGAMPGSGRTADPMAPVRGWAWLAVL